MELLLFGGTGEGRALAEWLRDEGIPVTVCVATAYGSTLLPPGVEAHTGRLDRAGMEALMVRRPYTCVIDATHPYAVEVTRQLQEAAQARGVPYVRLLRTSDGEDVCHKAGSMAEAAKMLQRLPGNILLTTGSKELHHFAVPGLVERCFPRGLPMMDSLERCLSLCMQGPFSQALNEALIGQYSIRTLVTKDTGSYGGFREKAQAAQGTGCTLLVVERPVQETGQTLEEIQRHIKEGRL